MKQIKFSVIALVVTVLTLSSCKYEEGPGISLIAKRDRLANEWVVSNYKIDGTDNDTALKSMNVGDSLVSVLSIMRTGFYTFDAQYTTDYSKNNNNKVYSVTTTQTSNANHVALIESFSRNRLQTNMGSRGKWSFDDKHRHVLFADNGNRDLSQSSVLKVLDCEIIKLKNKEIKLKFKGTDNKDHVVTFVPRNKENPSQR